MRRAHFTEQRPFVLFKVRGRSDRRSDNICESGLWRKEGRDRMPSTFVKGPIEIQNWDERATSFRERGQRTDGRGADKRLPTCPLSTDRQNKT